MLNLLNKKISNFNILKLKDININNNIFLSNFIQPNFILIIASNTFLINLCLDFYKNSTIYFIIYNNLNINEFLILKNNYPNIHFYFIGNNIDFNFYNTINIICKGIKFNTILFDNDLSYYKYYNHFLIISAYLLSYDLLIPNGTLIQFMLCPIYNKISFQLLNILYDSFNNHNNNEPFYYNSNLYKTFFIFNNLIHNNKKYYNFFINLLNNYYNEKKLFHLFNRFHYPLSDSFLLNIINRWDFILNLFNKYKNIKGGFLTYHRIKLGYKTDLTKIPILIDDLPNTNINEPWDDDINLLEFQPRCYWGQKKLLLSEIQFFTRIAKTLNITNFKDYAVVYIGAAGGFHLPILYKMFPDLIWLLYDPAPFSKVVYNHPIPNSVFVFNMFFTDDTINHISQYSQNRKIIFISDIRVNIDVLAKIKDMQNQANWGILSNADFMLLKFKLPYDNKIDEIPKNIKQLNLNKKNIINPTLKTKKVNSMIYLKGDIYLQLYPPIYSNELRLFVQKNNDKFELAEYNFKNIRNKIFNYNDNFRINFVCNPNLCNNIPYKLLFLIPGYDNSIECIIEYIIFRDFCNHFLNIYNPVKIINILFDYNILLQKYTKRNFFNCYLYYYKKDIKNLYNDPIIATKIELWKKIINVKNNLNIKSQIDYIKINGKNILGTKKYNNAINFLTKYYNNKLLFFKF